MAQRGLAQGAHKILEAVPLVQMAELLRGGAHRLDDDGDGTLLGVVGIDGDGDALALLVHPQDDELSRLGLLGDQRGLDLVQGDGGAQSLFSDDLVHMLPSFPIMSWS